MRRKVRTGFALATISIILFCGTPGFAQNADVKTFEPAQGPYGIVGVHTARLLDHLGFYVGLTTNYANDLLVGLVTANNLDPNAKKARPVSHRITMELAATLGLWKWVEFGLSIPFFVDQQSTNSPFDAGESGKRRRGIGDLRVLAKVRFLNNDGFAGFGLALVLEGIFPTGKKDAFMSSGGFGFIPRLIADWRHKSGFVVALNLAYKLQNKTRIGDLTVDDELRLGLGTEVPLFFRGLSLLVEANANIGVLADDKGRNALDDVPIELLTAVRWRHSSGFLLSLGTGFGVSTGYAAPDVRVFIGLGWGMGFQTPETTKSAKDRIKLVRVKQKVGSNTGLKRTRDPNLAPVKFNAYKPVPQVLFDKVVVSDPDPDGDGIPNSRDKCPNQPEDFDGFEDDDGCPDLDNDKDGIPDKLDKCPLQPETVNGVKDDDGCPDKGRKKVELLGKKLKITEKIFFGAGSDKIDPKSFPILKQVALFLKATWQIRLILVEGHTDSGGDKDMNVDLSERRALSVMQFLVKEGVAPHRLTARGFGPQKPIADNRKKQGRARNRRVDFTVKKVAGVNAK